VLAQSYPDFEIIISDNFSTDDTPEVARSFNDSRISYARPAGPLPIIESWRFALSHARGEYVTFLSDDDAFTINLLEKVKSVIDETTTELLCWKFAYYYPDEYKSDEWPLCHPLRHIGKNSLVARAFSSRRFEVDPAVSLSRALLNDPEPPESLLAPHPNGPLFSNAVYRRSLLNKIEERGLNLLRKNVVADIYAAFVAGLLAKKYFFLDEPLTIFRVHENSATANYSTEKSSLAKQFGETKSEERELLIPIKSFLNRNYYLNSILQAQRDCGENLGGELNRKNYFLTYHAEVVSYQERGVDMSEELNAFEAALSLEPKSLQEQIRSGISVKRRPILHSVTRKLPRPSLLNKMAIRLVPGTIHQRSILVKGEDVGVSDIEEYAKWLDESRLKELSDFCLRIFERRPAALPFKWRIG
jgi:glycosyltransferase involved in cell wall biosynthesis